MAGCHTVSYIYLRAEFNSLGAYHNGEQVTHPNIFTQPVIMVSETKKLEMDRDVAHQYLRESLETLMRAANLDLLNEYGEPLRNFQLIQLLEERLQKGAPMKTCSIHSQIELVDEPGGPTMPTIFGRTYCPVCQDEFNAALDKVEEERRVKRDNQ